MDCKPKVLIVTSFTGSHSDSRRDITDYCLPNESEIPFPVKQYKVVATKPKAYEDKMAVGDHYHPINPSGPSRHEFFIASGPPDVPLYDFWYRRFPKGEVTHVQLKNGDACDIPPGFSHTFVPLVPNAALIGFSNMAFAKDEAIVDKIPR